MSERVKVFLSWSGERSKALASALHRYLRIIIQQCDPWMSREIEAGKKWGRELTEQLQNADFGIICVTPENLDSRWLNFEAGAISKQVGDSEKRVAPLLLGLQSADVQGPLADFQMKLADQEGVLDIVRSINALTRNPLAQEDLKEQFEAHWPKLEKAIRDIGPVPVKDKGRVQERNVADKVDEILQRIRSLERSREHDLAQALRYWLESAASGASRESGLGDPLTFLLMPGLHDLNWKQLKTCPNWKLQRPGKQEEAPSGHDEGSSADSDDDEDKAP